MNLEYDDLKEKIGEHSDENTRKIQINFPDESTETLNLVDKNIQEMLGASLKVLEVKKEKKNKKIKQEPEEQQEESSSKRTKLENGHLKKKN